MLEHHRNELPECARVKTVRDDRIGRAAVDRSARQDLILGVGEHHDCCAGQRGPNRIDDRQVAALRE
jgi:hypothetical protein